MTLRVKQANEIGIDKLGSYFTNMINCIFKILPMRENDEPTLEKYVWSLKNELIGCGDLITGLNEEANFVSLVSTINALSNTYSMSKQETKSEVFKAISICEKLSRFYKDGDVK